MHWRAHQQLLSFQCIKSDSLHSCRGFDVNRRGVFEGSERQIGVQLRPACFQFNPIAFVNVASRPSLIATEQLTGNHLDRVCRKSLGNNWLWNVGEQGIGVLVVDPFRQFVRGNAIAKDTGLASGGKLLVRVVNVNYDNHIVTGRSVEDSRAAKANLRLIRLVLFHAIAL